VSVFCICCWPLPPQFFSGPSTKGLATIFYCLWFETSLFIASYDSQGHDGGIRPHLHTGIEPSSVVFKITRRRRHNRKLSLLLRSRCCDVCLPVCYLTMDTSYCWMRVGWNMFAYSFPSSGPICHNTLSDVSARREVCSISSYICT
jgi:hypothetical protein